MPFIPDDTPKKGFIPDDAPHSSFGKDAQAGLEGAGEAMTLGYLPQAQAAQYKVVSTLAGLLGAGPEAANAKLRAQGFSVPEDTYDSLTKENVARQEQEKQESPKSYMGGQLAGSAVLGAMMPAAGAEASLGAKIGSQALQGAAQGALYNPGEGLSTGDSLKQRALGGVAGGLLGGAGQAVASGFEGAAQAVKKIPGVSDKIADWLARQSAGISGQGTEGLGNKLVDEGVIGPRFAQRAQVAAKKGPAFENIRQIAQEIPGTHSTYPAAKNMEDLAMNQLLPGSAQPATATAAKNYEDALKAAEAIGNHPAQPNKMSVLDMVEAAKQHGDEATDLGAYRQAPQGGLASIIDRVLPQKPPGFDAQIAKTNQASMSRLAKDTYAAKVPPGGNPLKLSDAYKTSEALQKANSSLKTSGLGDVVKSLIGIGGRSVLASAVGAGAGELVDDPKAGAMVGAGLGLAGPAAASLAAHALQRGVSPAMTALGPAIAGALTGAGKGVSGVVTPFMKQTVLEKRKQADSTPQVADTSGY